jgi:hypothetical protein
MELFERSVRENSTNANLYASIQAGQALGIDWRLSTKPDQFPQVLDVGDEQNFI